MRARTCLGLGLFFLILGQGCRAVSAGRTDSRLQNAVEKKIPLLQQWTLDPIIVGAIKRANARPRSTRTITEIDKRWQSTPGTDPLVRSLMTNDCAMRLRALQSALSATAEAFVTDRLGATVAMTHKTSDFWQGDEDKFTKALAGRRGSYHIDPPRFDEAPAIQIALPVFDAGTAIGVMVVTLDREKL